MMNPKKDLGVMRPLGGGDPIPLKKEELVVGRRPTCDIHLNFENISGKHCVLRYVRGTWHVRDLGSTNGTTVNGQKISSEHGLLSDDELGISGHYYTLDYDAAAPSSLMDANMLLEEELADEASAPRQRSLMELAGLENPDAPRRPQFVPQPQAPQKSSERVVGGGRAPEVIDDEEPPTTREPRRPAAASSAPSRPSSRPDRPSPKPPVVEPVEDADAPMPASDKTDDDFFDLIKDDVQENNRPRRKR